MEVVSKASRRDRDARCTRCRSGSQCSRGGRSQLEEPAEGPNLLTTVLEAESAEIGADPVLSVIRLVRLELLVGLLLEALAYLHGRSRVPWAEAPLAMAFFTTVSEMPSCRRSLREASI